MPSRQFHISDILSITTGYLVSNRKMDGVYDILNFMTGEMLFTHQLPRAADECTPHLLRQYPILGSVNTKRLDMLLDRAFSGEIAVKRWVEEECFRLGIPEMLDVEAILSHNEGA
jgi:hypothetical protein